MSKSTLELNLDPLLGQRPIADEVSNLGKVGLTTNVDDVLNPRGLSQHSLFQIAELDMRTFNAIARLCDVKDPSLGDFYNKFCKRATGRTLDLENKPGIGLKMKAHIIDSLLEARIIVPSEEEGEYLFHPRVFNASPTEWCEAVASPEEMEALTEALSMDLESLRGLSFKEFQKKVMTALSTAGDEASTLRALLVKSGLLYSEPSIRWSHDFMREMKQEIYPPEALKPLSEIRINDLHKDLSMGRDPKTYFTLIRAFEAFNPTARRDMTFNETMALLAKAAVPKESALIFLIKLADRNLSVHFGLAEGEEDKAREALVAFREAEAAGKARAAEANNARQERIKAQIDEVMYGRARAGIRLATDDDAEIIDKALLDLNLSTGVWNKLVPALTRLTGKAEDELRFDDLFNLLDGAVSQAAGNRAVNFQAFEELPGVGPATLEQFIDSLFQFNIVVPTSGAPEDKASDREYDFHPEVYGGGIGEWIAVRCDEEEFNFVADMLGMNRDELMNLSFKDFNGILLDWHTRVGSRNLDEKKRLLAILKRTDLFDIRKQNANRARQPYKNFNEL